MAGGKTPVTTSTFMSGPSRQEFLHPSSVTLARLPSLLFVTQLVDPDDPVLGFVVDQIRALRAEGDVIVVANEVRRVPPDLEGAVLTLGKERGNGRTRRTARYLTIVARLAVTRRVGALLAHMCPVYLVLAAPITKVARVRTALWFVHPSDTPMLRLAERLADVVVTAMPGSYPRRAAKVLPIGHAIDTDHIQECAVGRRPGERLRLLALGRTSAVKGYRTLIRATATARDAGADVDLRIVGPSVTSAEAEHRRELEQLVGSSGAPVHIEDGVARGDVAQLLTDAHALVNTTERGSADKVVFEAMAAGRPVLVTSDAFAPLVTDLPIALLSPPNDTNALAARITALATAPPSVLDAVGRELRHRVARDHSLRHWAQSVRQLLFADH
jgi:glycosyltransferase involved in cell wall biosynthesis